MKCINWSGRSDSFTTSSDPHGICRIFGGDSVENEVVDEKFKTLMDHISWSQLQNLRFNLFNNFMIRQTPDLMSFALRMYYAMTYVTDESVASSGGEISSTGEYVQQTVIRHSSRMVICLICKKRWQFHRPIGERNRYHVCARRVVYEAKAKHGKHEVGTQQ